MPNKKSPEHGDGFVICFSLLSLDVFSPAEFLGNLRGFLLVCFLGR